MHTISRPLLTILIFYRTRESNLNILLRYLFLLEDTSPSQHCHQPLPCRAYRQIWLSAWRTTIWEITETKSTLWLPFWLRCRRCTSTIQISSTPGRNRLPHLQLIVTEEWIVSPIGAARTDPGTFMLVPYTNVRGQMQLQKRSRYAKARFTTRAKGISVTGRRVDVTASLGLAHF
jgi:hypothetical protein